MSKIANLLHEQYKHDESGNLVVFGCSECDVMSLSLGWIHGHIESHRGYTRFNIQLPFTETSPGNVDDLMDHTEIYSADELTEIELAEVDGL